MLSPITALFLALACHTVLCAPGIQHSLSIEEEYMEKEIEEKKMKLTHKWIKKNGKELYKSIVDIVGASATLGASIFKIPNPGQLVTAILKAPLLAIPEADKLDGIRSEMNALNTRLDNFYEELKWASNDLQGVLNNIDNAWLKYQEMKEDQNILKNTFFPFYHQYVGSVLILHKLISKPERDTQSLADVLAKRFRCHEKYLEELFLYVRKLICRGNEMDEKYYEFMGMDVGLRKKKQKKSKKILQDCNLAFFTAHQRCVSNRELYIKRDVIERINDKNVHQDIANNIGTFLREKYDRYDWLVFAFTTHFSKTMARFMKRHLFSGFTEIERGTVTVAVASQVRGSYVNTKGVKDNLDTFLTGISCTSVEKALVEYGIMNDITAVHVYKSNKDSTEEKDSKDERLEESFLSTANDYDKYTYTGECKRMHGLSDGQYTILIKSDEERAEREEKEERERGGGEEKKEESAGKHLCKILQCQQNKGKCVIAPRTETPMCQCDSLYYGRECEHEIDCTTIVS